MFFSGWYHLEFALILLDLVFHSFNFEDVPLCAMTNVDVAWLGHRIHREFVGFLFKNVANFECA